MSGPRNTRRLLGLALWALTGCASGAVLNAAVNTGIGLSAASVRRSQGGCVATCIDGTSCNADTGLCERPCDGQCFEGEVCQHGYCMRIDVGTTTVAP